MSAPSTLFIGTYTETPDPDADAVWPEVGTLRTAAEGIYVASFDPAAGVLSAPSLAAEQEISPSWLRWHPELPVLYSTGETWDGSPSTLSSYALAPAGPPALSLTGRVSTGGGSGCHFSLHPRLGHLAVANHGLPQNAPPNCPATSGSVGVVALDAEGTATSLVDVKVHPLESDARLRAHPGRTDWTTHAHSANWSPSGKWLFVCEKGIDRVVVYAFDEGLGTVAKHSESFVTIGGGARHLALHPSGKFLYVNEEAGGVVWGFNFDETSGLLTPFEIEHGVRWRADLVGSSSGTAEMSLSRSGDRLYVASRGTSLITTFEVDEETGKLRMMAHTAVGKNPRHFQIDPR